MGMPVPPGSSMTIVATNKTKLHGAIAIKDIDKISQVADRYGIDLAIIPSSIHEILLVPVIGDGEEQLSGLHTMIEDINKTQLKPEEVLSNHAYRFNRKDRTITYDI